MIIQLVSIVVQGKDRWFPAAPYHLHGAAVVRDVVEVMREMKPVAVAAAPSLECVQLISRN